MIKRLKYIDIAKGIGILFVVFSHSGGEKDLMVYIGGFFIPLFFILSGFTYNPQKKEILKNFLLKKLQRLMVPYLFFNLALLLIYHCYSSTDFLGVFYSRYCFYEYHIQDNIYMMKAGNAPMWFLSSMFTAYMAFWLIMRYYKKSIYVVSIFLLMTFVLDFLPILLPWSLDTAFLMAIFILIGTKMKDVEFSKLGCGIMLLLFMLYLALCYVNGIPNLSVRVYGRSFLIILLTGSIGSLLIVKISKWFEHFKLGNALAIIGRHSLVIFCIQMLLLRMQNKVFFDILHIQLNTITLYATSLLKTVLVAVLGVCLSKGFRYLFPKIF